MRLFTSLQSPSNFITVAISTSTSLTNTVNFVAATGGAGGFSQALPSAINGRTIVITKIDAGAGAITVTGLNGSYSAVLNNQNDSIAAWSDGTKWYPYA